MSSYKYCIVPMCGNTSINQTEKLFLYVPNDEARRKKWIRIMRRETPISSKTRCYVCEDHFDMPNDTENYMQVKMMGSGYLKVKKTAVPHIFDCQKKMVVPERPQSKRRKRKALVNELLLEHQQSTTDQSPIPEPSALLRMHQSGGSPKEEKIDNIPLEPAVEIKEEPVDFYPIPSSSTSTDPTANEEFILPHEDNSWTTPSAVVEPHISLSVDTLGSPSGSNANDNEPAKKKLKTSDSKVATHVPTTNGPTTSSDGSEHNFGDFSNPGFSRSKDQFDVFGEYIAAKLRSLDRVSCSFTQKAIADLIFEAEMGKYLNQTESAKL